MKICKIIIKGFQQFRDFELDLSYPKGHPLEGEPLEKACLIGQNGTGKSTLIRLINKSYKLIKDQLSARETVRRKMLNTMPDIILIKIKKQMIIFTQLLQTIYIKNFFYAI